MTLDVIGSVTTIKTLTIGDSLSFALRRSTYPASLWSMDFVLTLNGNKMFSVTATADADDHHVDLTPDQTLTMKVGRCQAWLVFTLRSDSSQRKTCSEGLLTILPNPLGKLPMSPNMLSLQAVNRAIQAVVGQPEATASFNGQSYSLQNLNDLYEIRNRLVVAVDAELKRLGIPNNGSGFKVIRTRFV